MISLQRYRELFGVPLVASTLRASLPGRLPIGVAGLAILLFVQARSGSFVQAGGASALYVLGLGVVAPFLGRLIDRLGPRAILAACGALYPVALVALVALMLQGAHPAWVAACAFAAGAALPPITICVRALLPRILPDVSLLQTAYSIDSVLIETVFVLGPALVAGFVAVGAPGGAVLFAAACGAAGAAVFLRAPALQAWRTGQPRRAPGRPRVLSHPRLIAVFAATVLYSMAFGLFEVAVTAFAAAKGAPAAAGIALALASVGSALGAFVYGSRQWRAPLARQFQWALLAMASGTALLAPVGALPAFTLACVVAGAPMATVIAAQSLLVSRYAPREALAESFTWGSTCLLGGVSAGIAAGGWFAEFLPPPALILAAAAATLLAALVAWRGLPAAE